MMKQQIKSKFSEFLGTFTNSKQQALRILKPAACCWCFPIDAKIRSSWTFLFNHGAFARETWWEDDGDHVTWSSRPST